MGYKKELIKFLTQDQISKDFMEMLEQKKSTMLDFAMPVRFKGDGSSRYDWKDQKTMKKELLKELGKGEDLLLTHLAHRIGLTR